MADGPQHALRSPLLLRGAHLSTHLDTQAPSRAGHFAISVWGISKKCWKYTGSLSLFTATFYDSMTLRRWFSGER